MKTRTYQERLEKLDAARNQRLEALRMREEGATFTAIGKTLGGISKQRAHKLVEEARTERDGG